MKPSLFVWASAFVFCTGASAKEVPDRVFIPRHLEFEAPADHYRLWQGRLPCPSGHLKTRMTVFDPAQHSGYQAGAIIHFWDDDKHENGVLFRLETVKHVLPLRAAVQEMGKSELRLAPQFYKPGESIDLEISWSGNQSFQFSVNGRAQFTMKAPRPVAWFNLMGVGSRSVFDNNKLECDLIS
jgi:hypothetical protein